MRNKQGAKHLMRVLVVVEVILKKEKKGKILSASWIRGRRTMAERFVGWRWRTNRGQLPEWKGMRALKRATGLGRVCLSG